jgi:hypothetical protein
MKYGGKDDKAKPIKTQSLPEDDDEDDAPPKAKSDSGKKARRAMFIKKLMEK